MQKPPERVSSRLIKKEQSKLVKQTVWTVTIGILLVLAFLFFVLPNFIRIINAMLSTNPITEDEGPVILQAPVIAPLYDATRSAELAITGIGTPETKVVLILNGSQSGETTTKEDGAFELSAQLTEGENALSAFTVDQKGHESQPSKEYRVTLDTSAPTLEIAEPQEGQEFDSKKKLITVSGKTEAGVKLHLNDRFFLPKADGSFSTTFSLADGDNTLVIKATDEAGNQVEQTRVVKYKP